MHAQARAGQGIRLHRFHGFLEPIGWVMRTHHLGFPSILQFLKKHNKLRISLVFKLPIVKALSIGTHQLKITTEVLQEIDENTG